MKKKNRLLAGARGASQRRSKDASADDGSARRRLLEAAGQVFAEKGFERAMGKEICARARVNGASVNYYFGGMAGLYAAVVGEANARLVSFEKLSAAAAGEADARAKLEAILGVFVRAVTGPASTTWAMRVLGREIVSPSPELASFRESEVIRKRLLVRSIVAEIMGLDVESAVVSRACVSVIAPCLMLLVCDRRALERRFPSFGVGSADELLRHLVRFAFAGLAAVASDAKRPRRRRHARADASTE